MVTREEPGSSLFFFRFILPCLRSVLEAVSAGAVVSLGERAVACVFHVRVRTGRVDSRRLAQGGCVPVPRVASFPRALGSLFAARVAFYFSLSCFKDDWRNLKSLSQMKNYSQTGVWILRFPSLGVTH